MTLFRVAWTYLRGRVVTSALTVFSAALGVSLVIASVLLTQGVKTSFIEGTTDYNLIAGAKGSPMQLVLAVVFRLDVPTPNMLYSVYEQFQNDRRVEVAVPVGLGDAYQGFRYVATTPAYFAARPWRRKTFRLAQGRLFRHEAHDAPAYEAILGADVAKRTGLREGDRFYEGEEMAEYPLKVVGILRPTHSADDRAIFFSLATFWDMNEIAREMSLKPLTAVLVRPKRMSDLPSLHREFNVHSETQAVFPSAILLTIFQWLGLAEEVLRIILALVALVVMLHLFVSMYSATVQRKREIATMRALGARRLTILSLVLLEAATLTGLGAILGLAGGHGLTYLGTYLLAQQSGVTLQPFQFSPLQPVVCIGAMVLGTVAGLIPALLAYRTEVAENLAPLS
jgi:putative ABC transport system permease protein